VARRRATVPGGGRRPAAGVAIGTVDEQQDRRTRGGAPAPPYVVASHLTIAPEGAATLEQAFQDRLGGVEGAHGFQRLEVWRDTSAPSEFVMVSWWDTEADFRAYMGSDAHRRSHARIPRDPHAPHPSALHRYEVIAT
jgi:heme oxygenase (mycobilin-producing)